MTLARRLLTSLTVLVAGCSLIVPGDVPGYRCTADEPSACPSGLVCDPAALVCVTAASVADGGDEEDAEPAEDAGADARKDGDAPDGPSPLGGACVVDGDCADGMLCGSSTILTTAIVPPNAQSVCTRPCCRSADCPATFVCFPGGTGGNYCVAASKADRTPPSSGGKSGGQSCAAHDECRSGLCTAGRCVDTCCEPSQCASGTTCRILTLSTHVGWACGTPNGGGALDLAGACNGNNANCKNDNCVQPFSAAPRCTPPCCSASDCAALGFTNNVCAYGQAGNDHLKWCFEPNGGGAAVGTTCSANADCASRYCDAELGRCANVCCTNADCGAGEVCLPTLGGTPFLRCVASR